jgi:hypothetical protein
MTDQNINYLWFLISHSNQNIYLQPRICIYIHTYMIFITLGDGPMDPLPRPPNQPIDPAHPRATDRVRVVDPHAPSVTDSFAPARAPARAPCWPAPPVQAAPQSSRCGPDRADRPQTPTTLCDSVIFVVRSTILIKRQLFSSFDQFFLLHCCYSAQPFFAIVFSHFCCIAQSFSLQCSAIFVNLVIPHCYSVHPFLVLQCYDYSCCNARLF